MFLGELLKTLVSIWPQALDMDIQIFSCEIFTFDLLVLKETRRQEKVLYLVAPSSIADNRPKGRSIGQIGKDAVGARRHACASVSMVYAAVQEYIEFGLV